MTCFIVPDDILKALGDVATRRISNRIRGYRNKVKRFFRELLTPSTVSSAGAGVPASARSTFHMHNKEKPLPGDLVMLDSHVKDIHLCTPAVQEAHNYADIVYDFMAMKLGRDSLDNKGQRLVSSCHLGENYNNAFWNGEQMAYGDGDGKYFLRFTRSLDVVGHELAHGLIQNTAGLIYFFESGALNEHFADVLGVVCKQWYLRQTVEEADWLVGADIIGPKFPGKAIRSFKNEKAYEGDRQPKHMKGKYRGLSDNGGVHWNSGITNHAFYLFCSKVGGVSYDVPLRIWYETLLICSQFESFPGMARKSLRVTASLFGAQSTYYQALKESWLEVGIKV